MAHDTCDMAYIRELCLTYIITMFVRPEKKNSYNAGLQFDRNGGEYVM